MVVFNNALSGPCLVAFAELFPLLLLSRSNTRDNPSDTGEHNMPLGPTTALSGCLPAPSSAPGTVQVHCREDARKGNYAQHISTHMAGPGGRRKRSQLQGRFGTSR